MAEMKKHESDSNSGNLKKADMKKSVYESNTSVQSSTSELFGGKRIKDTSDSSKAKARKKKRLSIAVDIIIVIVMVALVVGTVIGSYWLFRYYAHDYNGVDIQYTVAYPCTGDISAYASIKNTEIYCDVDGNTLYMGKVVDVQMVEAENGNETNILLMKINVNAKYRSGEGYSISDSRIAVGCEYKLRSGSNVLDVTVVELEKNTAGGK